MRDTLEEKSLLELLDAAISVSSYTSGSLSTTWQVFIQRYPHKEGDGFADGEAAYEVAKHGESLFGSRPAYKTIREALVAFIGRGLKEIAEKQAQAERSAHQYTAEAENWREHLKKLESLLVGSDE